MLLKKRGDGAVGGRGAALHPSPATDPEGDMRPSTSTFFRAVVLPFALLFVLQSSAQADKVDKLVKQMTTAGDYKLRLSAALNLAKMRSNRPAVIRGYIKALGDSDKTVRGVAAASLGKVVDSSVSPRLRDDAIAALKRARDNDDNSFVKRQAGKAYDQLKQIGGDEPSAGGIFVDVSGMSTKVDGAAEIKALMKKATLSAFKKQASDMSTSWPGGRSPSKGALAAKKMKGYHVSGTLTKLDESKQGSQTVVSCKVSMILATYPDKSMFGFADGGASVQASSTPKQVQYAREDCVSAVVESLVSKKIIPTIKIKAR